MRTIHKYPIPVEDEFVLLLPDNAMCLSVQVQNGEIQSWWEIQKNNPLVKRYFRVFGTGHAMPDYDRHVDLRYLATVQRGEFVWHIYEDKGARS